jgi:transposase InsO family protein
MIAEVIANHHLSQRRACGLIGITRRAFGRQPGPDRDHELRQRLRALAEARRCWGSTMLYQMLRRAGLAVNYKRIERLYREGGLSLRRLSREQLPVVGMRHRSGGRQLGAVQEAGGAVHKTPCSVETNHDRDGSAVCRSID